MRVACKYCWAIVVETEINFVYNFRSLLLLRFGVFDHKFNWSRNKCHCIEIGATPRWQKGEQTRREWATEKRSEQSRAWQSNRWQSFKNLRSQPKPFTLSSYDFPGFYLCVARLCYNDVAFAEQVLWANCVKQLFCTGMRCMCVCAMCIALDVHSFYTRLHIAQLFFYVCAVSFAEKLIKTKVSSFNESFHTQLNVTSF